MSARDINFYSVRVYPTPPNPAATLEDLLEFHNRRRKLWRFLNHCSNFGELSRYEPYIRPDRPSDRPSSQYEVNSFNANLRYVPHNYSEVEFFVRPITSDAYKAVDSVARFFRKQHALTFPITVNLSSSPNGIRYDEQGVEIVEAKPVYVRKADGSYSVEYPDAHYPSWYQARDEDIAMQRRMIQAAIRRSDLDSFSPYSKHPRY